MLRVLGTNLCDISLALRIPDGVAAWPDEVTPRRYHKVLHLMALSPARDPHELCQVAVAKASNILFVRESAVSWHTHPRECFCHDVASILVP